MSDDDLRVAEEHREAVDAYLGHPWYAQERDPDQDEDEE